MDKLTFSGGCCSSGILVSFSGMNLTLDQQYRIVFDNITTTPGSTSIVLNPTGYYLSLSDTSPVLSTFFSSKSNFSDNSSLSLIRLSVYDSAESLVYTDYKSIACENLCGSGIPLSPTPTMTPTITPTITQTPTPSPSPPYSIPIKASFDNLINSVGSCKNALIKAKAYGIINQQYRYSFNTDMSGVDLKISNPSGYIILTENPQYIYTTISLPESCRDYNLEFGLSDGTNHVQAAASFRCGVC